MKHVRACICVLTCWCMYVCIMHVAQKVNVLLFHNLLQSVDHHKHTVTQLDPWYSSSCGFAIIWDHYHCVELKFSHSSHDATASTFTAGATICMFVLSVPSVASLLFNLSPVTRLLLSPSSPDPTSQKPEVKADRLFQSFSSFHQLDQ